MRDYKLTMAIGVSQRIVGNFRLIAVHTAADPVLIYINGQSAGMERNAGDIMTFERDIVEIQITSATAQSIVLVLGNMGEHYDQSLHRVSVLASAVIGSPNQILSPARVVVGAGAGALVHAAHTKIQHLYIKRPVTDNPAISLFLGDVAVAANTGISLDVGEGLKIDSRAALYAWNPGGTAQNVDVMALRIP